MILITGGHGQLAECLQKRFAIENKNVCAPGRKELDITDRENVWEFFKKNNPKVVIHTAAYVAVDKAEEEEELCTIVNVQGTKNIAQACKEFDAYLMYISTDYVFNGDRSGEWETFDQKDPQSVYGRTKSVGEDIVLETSDRFAVIRTAWLYSDTDKNFVGTIIRQSNEVNELNVVCDQFGTPTYAVDLAELIYDLVEKKVSGIFHGTNEGFCNWAEFAEKIFELSGKKVKVNHVTTDQYPTKATRPKNSRLSKSSLDRVGVARLPHWEDALRRRMYRYNGIKRVFVTGASGYIGRHVVTALCDMGAHVLIANRHAEEVDQRAERINVDIFNGSDRIFREIGSPDVVIHLAWRDGFIHNSDAHMCNLSSHYTFIRNLLRGGLKHIAVMGTMHEVGYFEGAIDENTPCNPTSMYGIAKDALRRCTLQLGEQYGVCVQWLRAYYIYGDDKKSNSIFGKILSAEENSQEVFPFTTGKCMYDFIHIEELAKQIATCAMQNEVQGIINCCTGQPMTLAEKVESFIKERGLKIRLNYGAFPDRPYDSPGVWGNADKINQIMRNL